MDNNKTGWGDDDRPDPILDQAAYEKWYYNQTPEIQALEWANYNDQAKLATSDIEEIVEDESYTSPIEEIKNLRDSIKSSLKESSIKDEIQLTPNFISLLAKPFIIAITTGIAVLLLNYNQLIIGQVKQFLSPSSLSAGDALLVDASGNNSVSPAPRVILPKIGVDAPVVYDEKSYDEDKIQTALERGVVHYGTTALPGEIGNSVILGHSSGNFFNDGKYKYAFVLLDRFEINDTFSLHYEGTRYTYKVTKKEITDPTDFSVIQPTDKPVATLITCSPPGTNWKRLIIVGEQISPDPALAKEAGGDIPTTPTEIVPSNSKSLFRKILDIL